MRRKYGVAIYTPSRWSNHGYKHLEFRFIDMSRDYNSNSSFMSLIWQSHLEKNGEAKDWYACNAKVETSDPDILQMALNMVKRLAGDGSLWNLSPEAVIDFIEGKRDIRLVTYDSRINKFVYNEDVAPPEWIAWRDADNQVHAIAADYDSAQDAVEARLREVVEQRYFGSSRVDEFIAAGRPVAVVDRRRGPVVATREEAVAV